MDEFKTRDLAESSALIIKGKILERMEREGRVCIFVFKDRKKCEEISNQYFFGELEVNAREFYETIIRLKNRIFAKN